MTTIGILEDTPQIILRRRLVNQIGLYGVALSEEQEGVISAICGMLPVVDDPQPLSYLAEKDRVTVAHLMRQLPTTHEITRYSEGQNC